VTTPTPPPTPEQLADLIARAARTPLTYPEANRLRVGIRRLAEQRDTLIETLAQARRTAGGQQAAMDKLRRQAKNAETETETLRAGFRAIGGDPTRVQNLQAQLTMTVRLRKHAEAERDRYRAAWHSARRRATQGRQQADREHADALARLRDGRRRDGVAARITKEALQQQINAQAREIDRLRDKLAAAENLALRGVAERIRARAAAVPDRVYEAQLVTELTAQPGYTLDTLHALGTRPARYAALRRAAERLAQAAHNLDNAAGRIHL